MPPAPPRLLDAAATVSVVCHVYPDADTIGAGLALALVLEQCGKRVEVGFAEPSVLPESLQSLPGGHLLVPPTRCAATAIWWSRSTSQASTGSATLRARRRRSRSPGDRPPRVQPAVRDGQLRRSVGGLDDDVGRRAARRVGQADRRRVAHCLYAGLTTDTGSFRWASARAHRLAARLLELGVDNATISRTLLDTHPFSWLPMLSRVLSSAQLVADALDGRGLVYAVVGHQEWSDARPEEVESIVDIVRTTRRPRSPRCSRRSSRSTGRCRCGPSRRSIWPLSRAFGGGGHRLAAGYSTSGSVDEVLATLRAALG